MSNETSPHPTDPHAEHRRPLLPGTPAHIGRYEVLRVLGNGTFGLVYVASDPDLERYVAIKTPILVPNSHRDFLREARAVADIHHPNICPVYDVGEQAGMPYIVMRYVHGGTLNTVLESGLPTLRNALRIAGQIARGLEAAHAHGVIHRDLKPANVLYDEATRELLLSDFGVARWVEATATIGGGGNHPHMAPEQWERGGRFGPVTPRTDVYGLGVILFRLLTGELLFTGDSDALKRQHCGSPPRRPSSVRPGLDPRLDALCLKALHKTANDRYGSAQEFAQAIADCLRSVAVAVPQVETWHVSVPGMWSARPVGNDEGHRHRVATPAEITIRSGELYRLTVDRTVRDHDLAGLEFLRDLPAFQSLDLSGCRQITDDGLEHLRGLTSLRSLDLSGCDQITNGGLAHVQTLTALRSLNLLWCDQITYEGISALRRALPNCVTEPF